MKPEHASPDDPLDNASDSLDSQRLADIERQLRQARPVAPQLDPAAIERLAREASVLTTPAAGVEEPLVVPKQAHEYEHVRRARSYGAIAGSWICGALVGAVAMFLYQGRSPVDRAPPAQPTTIAVDATGAEPMDPPATSDRVRHRRGADMAAVASNARADRPEFAWLVSPELVDMYRHGNFRLGRTPSTWRVGMCLPGMVAASQHSDDALHEEHPPCSPVIPSPEFTTPREHRRDFEPAPAITREQMLRELMSQMSGPVL